MSQIDIASVPASSSVFPKGKAKAVKRKKKPHISETEKTDIALF